MISLLVGFQPTLAISRGFEPPAGEVRREDGIMGLNLLTSMLKMSMEIGGKPGVEGVEAKRPGMPDRPSLQSQDRVY